MPATIRIRVDGITADLAAGRLREEGIPVQVVSDENNAFDLGTTGTPMSFSLVVPAQYEEQARRILGGVAAPSRERRRSRSRNNARRRR